VGLCRVGVLKVPGLLALVWSAGLLALMPEPASAQLFDWGPRSFFDEPREVFPKNLPEELPPVRRAPNRSTKYDKDAGKFGALKGPLTIVVSVAKQRVTLFADGKEVAEAPVSTGTIGHETPMGIYAVIAKSRFHESNIYSGAPMPYMQRITWSGIALHEGPLPGHAASHGCIRLPGSFASSLFKVTRMGARVVITRDSVAPVAFASPLLFVPKKPEPVETPVAAAQPVVVADVQATASIRTDEPKAVASAEVKPDLAPAAKPEVKKRKGPVQVFVSRKSGRLYVRQDFQPLFDAPVTIAEPEKPWGTHIFTAMEIKDEAVRWTAITIPSGYAAKPEPKHGPKLAARKLSARELERREKLSFDLAHAPAAAIALERFVMPKDAVDRISELLGQGSSLIVSDNALSEETGLETDFVVATP
jgi:hypothetical protein